MTIQWFPGHMAKARREMEEKLKLVDFVVELLDARTPWSSQNPMLAKVVQGKPKLVVLMKKDLADPESTGKWLNYFHSSDVKAIAMDVNNQTDLKQFIQAAKELGEEKRRKLQKKGIQPRASRAMIAGIPNVGKSTLINRLARKKIAKTGDLPGITKQQAWIKIKNDFELLDTPGVLWPKFEDEQVGLRLAAVGTIKDQLLTLQDVAAFILQRLQKHYAELLQNRYEVEDVQMDIWELFNHIGKRRGALESGGQVNMDKVAEIIIRDLRTGKLGRITLETPE
ncbi:ribosome biogenesis GTPase YlqF [Virgibacillus halophilus]|uniref:Ribosome biogenesis GTPase A n=1 Tax=Tigheibacillus halophilus TaxID=361280 RepID=A0ABU5CAK9_9BACI|nr:ribosome biogenesis GTPase YlqF [Virgibacillus halophilus]